MSDKDIFMQHKKPIYLSTLLVLLCTNLHSMEIVLRPEPNSIKKIEFLCPKGESVSEIHFATGETNWQSSSGRGEKIETWGLFVHQKELDESLLQMKIGVDCDDNNEAKYLIPADDPLRKDNSLLVNLNTFVASKDGDWRDGLPPHGPADFTLSPRFFPPSIARQD